MDNSYFSKKPITVTGDPVDSLGNTTMDLSGKLIRSNETGDKVFLVKNGSVIHWVTSPEVLTGLNRGFDDIETVTRDVFRYLKLGERITLDNIANYVLPPKVEEKKEEVVEEPIPVKKEEFETYPEVAPHEQLEGVVSYVIVVNDITQVFEKDIKRLKEILSENSELILVVNGTSLRADNYRFMLANKVIINEQKLPVEEAINQGLRVAQGEFSVIVY